MNYWRQEVSTPSFKIHWELAHWMFDETEGDIAYDSVAENDAQVVGDALWQSDGGHINGAIQLDGLNDYVDTPFVLNPKEGVFSVFAWIKGGAPGQAIISQADGQDWLVADSSAGQLSTRLSPPPGRSPFPPLISDIVITDGTWHRVGLVWDESDRVLYVDNVEVARDTVTPLDSASGNLFIGANSNLDAGSFWSGMIDDVRIYDRVVEP